jgi:hypothetical protein
LVQNVKIAELIPDTATLSEDDKEEEQKQIHLRNFKTIKKVVNILKDLPNKGDY